MDFITINPKTMTVDGASLPRSYRVSTNKDNTVNLTDTTTGDVVFANLVLANLTNDGVAFANAQELQQVVFNFSCECGSSPNPNPGAGYVVYLGPVAAAPASGQDVKDDTPSTTSTANVLMFNTGTADKNFVIAIPAFKNLVSVVNNVTTENMTANFVLSGAINTVPDGVGSPIPYKVYVMTTGVPFSNGYSVNVTLS